MRVLVYLPLRAADEANALEACENRPAAAA